jgi:hypothetical protein
MARITAAQCLGAERGWLKTNRITNWPKRSPVSGAPLYQRAPQRSLTHHSVFRQRLRRPWLGQGFFMKTYASMLWTYDARWRQQSFQRMLPSSNSMRIRHPQPCMADFVIDLAKSFAKGVATEGGKYAANGIAHLLSAHLDQIRQTARAVARWLDFIALLGG